MQRSNSRRLRVCKSEVAENLIRFSKKSARIPQSRHRPFAEALCGMAFLCCMVSGCQSPIQNSVELRRKAAGTIGRSIALPTVWNIAAPLELGRVYTMAGDAAHGYFLMPGSEVFVEQTKALSQSSTYNAAWSETRSGAWNVNAQLTYMGLRGDAAFKNVRSVAFSLTGDQYAFVNNAAGFDNLINLPTFGPALRKKILEDTLRLKAAGLAAGNAKYWIVVQLLTAKNLTVDFTNSTSASAGTDVVDPRSSPGG